MSYQVLQGDARNLPLDDDSVDLIVTSPPYFALRSYRDDGEHYDGQIGSEPTPTEFLDALVECTREMVRVLKPTGSIFVNLGDKFSGGQPHSDWGTAPINHGAGVGSHERLSRQDADLSTEPLVTFGAVPAKSRMLLPHRYAIRCIDELGLICRMDMVWSKPNGLPESVTDRVRASHEFWFHLVKSPRYFTGIDEIRQPHQNDYEGQTASGIRGKRQRGESSAIGDDTLTPQFGNALQANPLGRLPGSVWNIPSEPLIIPDSVREAKGLPDHFAAFPQEWPRRLILGFSPTGICTECEQPRRAIVAKSHEAIGTKKGGRTSVDDVNPDGHGGGWDGNGYPMTRTSATIDGYECGCAPVGDPAPTRPAVVLDPFGGTGTTAGVAHTLGRHGISVDLSADYCRLAEWRITESGHFDKSRQRMWADRQTQLL